MKKKTGTQQQEIKLVGIDLGHDTTTTNGQADEDCAQLWKRFMDEDIAAQITDKIGDELYAVYYRKDNTTQEPFRYFLGCRVDGDTLMTNGLDALTIPAGSYHTETAEGALPESVKDKWKEINSSSLPRAYDHDYEVYDMNTLSSASTEVDIRIS